MRLTYAIIALMLGPMFKIALAEPPYPLALSMDEYITMLASDVTADQQDATIALSMLAATDFGKLEKASANTKSDSAQRLGAILDREKTRNTARAAKNKREAEVRDWNDKAVIEAYDKVGRRNPKWDADARAGILAFVNGTHAGHLQLSKAIEAGCDDPFVLYAEARSLEQTNQGDAESIRQLYRLSLDGFGKSEYPALRKANAASHYFRCVNNYWGELLSDGKPVPDDVVDEVKRSWAWSYDMFPDVVRENPPAAMLFSLASQIMDNFNPRVRDRSERFDPMFAELQKAIPNSATLYLIEGDYHRRHAWDQRDFPRSGVITAGNIRLFKEYLAKAEESLTRAYDLDPAEAKISSEMMTVELGQHKGHDIEEKWFTRAIAADPDDFASYRKMADYLSPARHGSENDVLKFARECYDGGNWFAGIPEMIVLVHEDLAQASGNPSAYYRHSTVWRDVKYFYEPYLRVMPGNHTMRSSFAAWACYAGHWDVAKKQFGLLGDEVVASPFGGREQMEACRKQALGENSPLTP